VVYVLAALAAFCNAGASVLERHAAARTTQDDPSGLRLMLALVRQPAWLGGIASMIGAFVFQAAALDRGRLGVVQTILVVELPITLLLSAVAFRRPLAGRDLLAALGMSAGLAVLLLAAEPTGGTRQPNIVAWGFLLIASTGGLIWLVGLGRAARGKHRAALYGIASGIGFGVTAVFIKGATERLGDGVLAAMSSWQLYSIIVSGTLSVYLLQRALQAGSLSVVQPGVTIIDPIVAVVCGVMLFGEKVRVGVALIPELFGIAILVYGVLTLSRSSHLEGDVPAGGKAPSPSPAVEAVKHVEPAESTTPGREATAH
jgi:drug/metabolite transporter (DMT)-like permease